jgi:hypothetical protein
MNLCIVNKKPQPFAEVQLEKDIILVGENVEINVDEIYACLYFEDLKIGKIHCIIYLQS